MVGWLGGLALWVAGCTNEPAPTDDTDVVDTDLPEESDPPVDDSDTPVDDFDYDALPVMVRVAPATFTQGPAPGEFGATPAEVARQVTLTTAFEIGETEIMQGQWLARMGYETAYWGGCPRCPVESITWHEAAAFTNALSEAEGLETCFTCTLPPDEGQGVDPRRVTCVVAKNPYTCAGYRLPTEAEWELAARSGGAVAGATPGGGSLSDAGLLDRCEPPTPLDDGTDLGDQAWFCANSDATPGKTIRAVGGRTPNALGLHDMLGNVWEMCLDRWEPVFVGDAVDPTGPLEGDFRSIRGGGWNAKPRSLRVSFRTSTWPANRADNLGFRVARTAMP